MMRGVQVGKGRGEDEGKEEMEVVKMMMLVPRLARGRSVVDAQQYMVMMMVVMMGQLLEGRGEKEIVMRRRILGEGDEDLKEVRHSGDPDVVNKMVVEGEVGCLYLLHFLRRIGT